MSRLRYASYNVVLEPDRWQVNVGSDVFTPEPKVFELLSYLMRHSGRVVSKAELLDSLWSGDVVGESVLTRCVSCARKLLGDDSKTPRFIRTLHGRGYEFIAPVSALAHADPLPNVGGPGPSVGAVTVAAPPVERPFVGRKAEAQRLAETLRQLEARQGGFVLVNGEAGIGKTRLLEEALRRAPLSVETHLARCTALEGAPALLVWQQCFRSLVRARSVKVVGRALEGAPSGARKLLLGTERWRVEDQLGWDSPSERFRTFDAIAHGLVELAEQRPLALVFDDLHAADLVSLLLLEFLTQTLQAPILLAGATRDTEQLAPSARTDALARLRAGCRSELTLTGLSREEVREFVAQRRESDADALLASLFSRTGGNPFFLSVLSADQAAAVGDAPLPSAVKQLSRTDWRRCRATRLSCCGSPPSVARASTVWSWRARPVLRSSAAWRCWQGRLRPVSWLLVRAPSSASSTI